MSHACHHFWKCYKTFTFCSFLTRCTIPCAFHAKRHLNAQKWSKHVVFLTFWLRHVLRTTTACTFSTCQLPRVLREWCVFRHIFVWGSCFWPPPPPPPPAPPPPTIFHIHAHTHTHIFVRNNFVTHLLRNIIANFCCGMHRTCKSNPVNLTGKFGWLSVIFSEKYFLRPCSEVHQVLMQLNTQ